MIVTIESRPMRVNNVKPGMRKLLKGENFSTVSTDIPRSFPDGSTIIEYPAAKALRLVMINSIIPVVLSTLDLFMKKVVFRLRCKCKTNMISIMRIERYFIEKSDT